MFGDSPGHIAGYGAIGCSLLAVVINFMCVPMLMNQVAMLRENLQVDMDEFKVISDTAWDKMVDLRRTLETKNLRFTRQADAKESGEKRTTRASGEFKSRWWGHSTPQGQGWTGEWEQQWPTDQPWLAQNDGFVDSSCPPGQPGMPGAAGQDGQNGAKGADGEAGLDGNGLDGPIGEDGCIICPQGPQGAPGPIGPQGAPGEKGWPGIDGNPGSDGWPGPIGPRGFRGQEGVPGKRGIKGLPGKPAPGGKGEPGPKGAAGPIGRAGPQGPPGKPGYKAGPQGPQGKKGPKGVDGTPASDGERGPIGPTGFPGGDAKYCPCPKEITNTQQARPTAIPGPNQGWGSTRWNGPTPPYQQGWTDNVWGASPGWNAPGNQGDWWSGVDGK